MKESFENALVPCGGIGIPQRENGIPSRGSGWNSLKMETDYMKEIL